MKNIELIIKNNLKEETNNYLLESLKPISNINESDILREKLGNITLNLISDGYTVQEITTIVEQNSGTLGNLIDPKTGKFDLWGTLFGGGKSMFWEQILRWLFVKVLGTSEAVGQSAAVALSDYNPLHIFRLFKGYDSCVHEMGPGGLAATIAEIFINNSQFNGGPQKMGGVAIRNVAAEAVRESNLDDVLAEKICGYIWKHKSTPQQNKQSSNQNGQPPKQNNQNQPKQ